MAAVVAGPEPDPVGAAGELLLLATLLAAADAAVGAVRR